MAHFPAPLCLAGVALFFVAFAGELAAQSPVHLERGDVRERIRGVVANDIAERPPLVMVALQPLIFEPAGAGEVRAVDPLVDQGARGEFEITGDGWVEITVTLRMEESEAPLVIEFHPADIVALEPSGGLIVARTAEHLRERKSVTIRKEILVRDSALLFVGGTVVPELDHPPGEYRSRILVSGRYLDR